MTKYARDEFDKVPETASRQGVHRTATAPTKVRLWPILVVGVAALAIGLVSFLILPKLGLSAAGSQASPSQVSSSQEASPLASPGPTSSATADAPGGPSADALPSVTAEPEAEPEATAPAPEPVYVDKTQSVAIYNATGVAGLASRVGGSVQSDGWTLGQVGNWAGAPQQSSVVFYAGADQLPNAQALAGLLGIPAVVESTAFQVPLVVVLGPGFR